MNLQLKILLGIITWLAGVILDTLLVAYTYIFIYIGAAWTFFEIAKWLQLKENRRRVKQTFPFARGGGRISELIETLFDFSWARVSVLWTGTCAFGMIIVFLASIMMKSSGAYETAIKSIEGDEEITRRTGKIYQFSSLITGNVSTASTSRIHIGVIGRDESFWVIASVEPTDDGYETTNLEIK
jgi:hypothetical protein